MSKESEQIARIMAGLGCSEAEAREIYQIDCEIDHNQAQDFDLTPEQNKVAQKFAHTGTRKTTAYKFAKRERKPNATKAALIEAFYKFLAENDEFSVENTQITNKERQISFQIGEDVFELTLVQKRKPKK